MSERTVVVTGAGSGLGAAVAHEFAGPDTELYLADPDGDVLDRTVEAVSTSGSATGVRTDVRDQFDVERLVEAAASGGPIDCVVAASTISHEGGGDTPLSAASYAAFDDHVRTNARGVFATIREALPHLAPDARILVPVEYADAMTAADGGSYGVSLTGAVAVARGFAADIEPTVCIVETGLPAGPDANDDPDLEDVAELLLWAATEAPADRIDGQVVDRSAPAAGDAE